MSEHDPFDGIFDEPTPEPVHQPEQPPPASEVAHPETYSRGHLERLRKADLQVLARERSLDTTGDRDTLIDRIEAAQSR